MTFLIIDRASAYNIGMDFTHRYRDRYRNILTIEPDTDTDTD